MDKTSRFSSILGKGDHFCDCLPAFLNTRPLQKLGLLSESKLVPYNVDPFLEVGGSGVGAKNIYRVNSPEIVTVSLKCRPLLIHEKVLILARQISSTIHWRPET